MKAFHDIAETISFLPFLITATIQESGPSWRSSFNVVVGLMMVMMPAFGTYVIAQQEKTDDRQDAAIIAIASKHDGTLSKIDTADGALGDKLIVISTKLAEATVQLNELKAQFDAEKRRRETRDELDLAEGRAVQQRKK